jgi:hypothetical protein
MTKCYMKSQHPSTKIRRSKQHRFTCVCRLIHLKQKARRDQLAALDARASPPRTEQIPFPARVRAPLPAAAPHGRDASPPGAPDHRNGGELTLFPLLAHIPRTPAPVDPICESDAFFRAWGRRGQRSDPTRRLIGRPRRRLAARLLGLFTGKGSYRGEEAPGD